MTAIADYGGIVQAVVTVLKGDATLTALLGSFTPAGGTPSQANSIFNGDPPTGRVFPCITVDDMTIGSANPALQDLPFKYASALLQIDVWGASKDLRPICWEIDQKLATAYRSQAMDTVDWQFDFIATSGRWHKIRVPKEYVDGSVGVFQASKVFQVKAASKT